MGQPVLKDALWEKQNNIGQDGLIGLKSVLPEGYTITLLVEESFSDNRLYESLNDLGSDLEVILRLQQKWVTAVS